MFRFWWFVLWLTFVALLVFSIFMAFPGLLQRSAFSWLALWSVIALLWILASDAWLNTQDTNYFTQVSYAGSDCQLSVLTPTHDSLPLTMQFIMQCVHTRLLHDWGAVTTATLHVQHCCS